MKLPRWTAWASKFDRGPERRDDINLTIGFITDPVGTSIEITEGLDDVKP